MLFSNSRQCIAYWQSMGTYTEMIADVFKEDNLVYKRDQTPLIVTSLWRFSLFVSHWYVHIPVYDSDDTGMLVWPSPYIIFIKNYSDKFGGDHVCTKATAYAHRSFPFDHTLLNTVLVLIKLTLRCIVVALRFL